MKRWSWLLIAALVAAPALAADKKKDDKKGKEKEAAAAAAQSPGDVIKDAEAKLAAGDSDGAVKVLEDAKADGAVALRLGELRESRGELDMAVDAYKAAAESLSGAAKGEALGRMAVVMDTRGMGGAEETAEAAIAADPEGVWPTIAMSHRKVHEGKADEGVALAQKALAAGGGAAAEAALGHALDGKGDMAGAEAAYRKAMAEDATRIAPVVGLASVLRKTGRAAEAEPMLQKVIDASPGAVEAYKEQARVKLALGRAQDALGDASLAAAMSENDPEAQRLVIEVKVERALEAISQGQADLAVQDLTQLRDQNPDSAEVRLGLGRAQVARRDAAAAIAEFQKAAELAPDNADVQFELGQAELRLKGDAAGAVAPLQKAVSLKPGNAAYQTTLGQALVGAQKFDQAVELLTKATQAEGYARPEGFLALGQAYVNLKNYKEAVAPLEKATTLAPDLADAWATLGWAYFGSKDADKFKLAAGKARDLGYKEPTLLSYLKRIEAGEKIK
jgi:tetratricopeptide (TPR) repeat protein